MKLWTSAKSAAASLFGLAAISFMTPCVVAQQAPPAAPAAPAAQASVSVSENELGYVLDNGLIQAIVSRKSGDLISMKFKGTEMLGTLMKPDGTIDLETDPPGNPGRGRGMTDHMYGFWSHDTVTERTETKITINPKDNNGERAEVSVKGFSDGKKLGHGPGAAPDGDFAADIEIRYTLGRGDSGVYTYCIFEHKPEYPNATMGEARFCVKLNDTFDWILINEKHNQMYPMELEREGDNKYNYTSVQWENPVFGWASYYKNTGVFIVNASLEYLTGPPTKVEFLCHRDTTPPAYVPCILNYWRSSHYGGGGVDVAQGEHWTKVIGPFLIYCNNGTGPQSIFADAQAQQKKEAAKWPYSWVNGVDYPKQEQRSTVSGQLVLTDPLMPAGSSMSYLRVGLSHPDYKVTTGRAAATNAPSDIHWQVDSKHYQFWVRGDNDGGFSIPDVRPGKYTLHAIADGILGEYAKTDITVEAGKPLDLGKLTWTPVRKGRQLWDIGIANRSGKEFDKGDDYFHDGMATVYALLYPNDVNYTIGKSDFAHDWFYLHTTHASDGAIAAATVNAQPRAVRGGGGGARRGAASQPGVAGPRGGGLARGGARGPATLPGGAVAGVQGNVSVDPTTQPGAGGARAGGRGAPGGFTGARGAGPNVTVPIGAAGGAGGGAGRPSPWNVVFDLPAAPKGKATLRFGVATNNNANVAVKVNDAAAGQLNQMPSDSGIGRNGIQGIWFERELAFDASLMKPGKNTLTLTVNGGGIIYDYIRLELDENAN